MRRTHSVAVRPAAATDNRLNDGSSVEANSIPPTTICVASCLRRINGGRVTRRPACTACVNTLPETGSQAIARVHNSPRSADDATPSRLAAASLHSRISPLSAAIEKYASCNPPGTETDCRGLPDRPMLTRHPRSVALGQPRRTAASRSPHAAQCESVGCGSCLLCGASGATNRDHW